MKLVRLTHKIRHCWQETDTRHKRRSKASNWFHAASSVAALQMSKQFAHNFCNP